MRPYSVSETAPILQRSIPYPGWNGRPLPGVQPLDPADWLIRDEACTAQLALKAKLVETYGAEVVDRCPGSEAAEAELAQMVCDDVAARYDGFKPPKYPGLAELAGIVQEDFAILQKDGDAHVMTAGLIGFPASWRLSEKIGKPLDQIHDPVVAYDGQMAARVQRLFDGVQVGRPLWRYNTLWYHDPALYQPRSALAPRDEDDGTAGYLRSERQCILRLPQTGAVVFSIHTFVLARADVPGAQSR